MNQQNTLKEYIVESPYDWPYEFSFNTQASWTSLKFDIHLQLFVPKLRQSEIKYFLQKVNTFLCLGKFSYCSTERKLRYWGHYRLVEERVRENLIRESLINIFDLVVDSVKNIVVNNSTADEQVQIFLIKLTLLECKQ